jgi:hypothetical protein
MDTVEPSAEAILPGAVRATSNLPANPNHHAGSNTAGKIEEEL